MEDDRLPRREGEDPGDVRVGCRFREGENPSEDTQTDRLSESPADRIWRDGLPLGVRKGDPEAGEVRSMTFNPFFPSTFSLRRGISLHP